VVAASDGLEALGILSNSTFEVVVSDLSMPGLDGFQLLRAIRSSAEPPEVILLTGTATGDFDAAVRALRLGAHDYLVKPAHPEELRFSVRRAAQTWRLRDENRRLLARLEEMVRTDPLTGLGNRRSFDEALSREVSRSRRYSSSLALIVFDLDLFKGTNDRWGHAAGDHVLRTFARAAAASFREADLLFRIGGEEFVALLPFTDASGGLVAAETFLSKVRKAPVPFGGSQIPVTASAGVAALEPGDASAEAFLARADAALYAAKEAGRDRARGARSSGEIGRAPKGSEGGEEPC
jgi:diguanylate cyclase (GGDEF)-like protein